MSNLVINEAPPPLMRGFGRISTQIYIAGLMALSLNLSGIATLLSVVFLSLLFCVNGSVSRGLVTLFLAISAGAVLSSFQHFFGFQLDTPLPLLCTTISFICIISFFNNRQPERNETESFAIEASLSILLTVSAFFFRQISHLGNTKLFAMLLPEDNAAWVHASSGFLRFNASAAQVSDLDYGARSFLSSFLSFASNPLRLSARDNDAYLTLVNVANSYVFLTISSIILSSVACFSFFGNREQKTSSRKITLAFSFSLVGLITTMGVSKAIFSAGHLSLICSVFVIWACFATFKMYEPHIESHDQVCRIQVILMFLVSTFALGTVWFPLIPASVVIHVACVYLLLFKKAAGAVSFTFVQKMTYSVVYVIILVSAFHAMKVPRGYSVSSLINTSSGGTMVPTSIALSAALVGIVFVLNQRRASLMNLCLLASIPLVLLAYWVFSMSANPNNPGYSVEKFSLLTAVIGLPLFLGFCLRFASRQSVNSFTQIISPLLITAALLNVSWGMNSFPRKALLDQKNWGINYLPTLIDASSRNRDAQILCLAPQGQDEMVAYSCSRFASAFQFREFGTNNLARRWRSQLLGGNLDPANIPEDQDFLVPQTVNGFIENGGSVIVLLTPGPLWQIEASDNAEWMRVLPWSDITVIE
jgi:hypothetical protein